MACRTGCKLWPHQHPKASPAAARAFSLLDCSRPPTCLFSLSPSLSLPLSRQNGLPLSAPAVKAGRTGSLHRGSLIRFMGQLLRQSESRAYFKCRTECSYGGSREGKQAKVCPFVAWHAHQAGWLVLQGAGPRLHATCLVSCFLTGPVPGTSGQVWMLTDLSFPAGLCSWEGVAPASH